MVVPVVVGRCRLAEAQGMVAWRWGVGWMTVELWAECQKAWKGRPSSQRPLLVLVVLAGAVVVAGAVVELCVTSVVPRCVVYVVGCMGRRLVLPRRWRVVALC